MKYSLILPYYRRPELRKALESFAHHYVGRDDYEVLVVEDSKNEADYNRHVELDCIIYEFSRKMKIRYFLDEKVSYNPAHKYNLGVSAAEGQFIVLSNPEVVHDTNILAGLDEAFAKDPEVYVVCACAAIDKGVLISWYQHSRMRNALFHFCSAMSKANYQKVGGFDEVYCGGIGFEDEDFVRRVTMAGIRVIPKDDLITAHLEHDKEYIDSHRDLVEVNRNIFMNRHSAETKC